MVDFWEAFGEISCDYAIVSKCYQYKMGNKVDMIKYFCFAEDIYEYYITNSGMVKKRKKLRGMAILNVGRRDIIILNL